MGIANLAQIPPAAAERPTAAAAGATAIRVIDWREMDAESECQGWDALSRDAAEPNPFFESWFLLPALRALDPGGQVRLLCYETGGRLAGLMPLRFEKRYYQFPLPQLSGWVHPNCFLGSPLVVAGHEVGFWRALLDWADRHAGMALFLHLRELPLSGPLYSALLAVLAGQDRHHAVVRKEDRAMLASPLGAEAYFEASMSGKKRKELRRQFSRLAEHGTLTVERRRDKAGLDEWATEFVALELPGWKGKAGSALGSSPATARFFAEALRGAARSERLERLALRIDNRVIAMLATFICPPGAYAFKTTFDESYSRFSPGVLLQRENLVLLEDPAIAWTDSCAAADHPMIDRIWRERRTVGSLSIAIGGAMRRRFFLVLSAFESGRNKTEIGQ